MYIGGPITLVLPTLMLSNSSTSGFSPFITSSFYFEDVVPIGFLSSNLSVSEDGVLLQFEIGVMKEHYLEVEVTINFTTVQITAEGTTSY